MRVSLQLEPESARALHQRLQGDPEALQSSPEMQSLSDSIEKHNGKLQAVHPGQSHPLLIPFFSVETPTRHEAENLIADLERIRGVSGAYLSPEAEMP
jgi:hypothetical protein